MKLSNADLVRTIYTKKKYIVIKNNNAVFTNVFSDEFEMIDLCEPMLWELQNLFQSIGYVWNKNRYHENDLEYFLKKRYDINLRQYNILKNFLENK